MKKDELLREVRNRFKLAHDAVEEQNRVMLDDLNFALGEGYQWPNDLKKQREADSRPCLEINKIANYGDQVIGDIRKNSASIKVKPVDSNSDPDTAEVLCGLIRNIEVQSNAEIAYDTAAESCVWCGKGAFRIITEYAEDDTFDQDIRIKRIKNPMTVFWDPGAQEFDRSDASYCFVTEKISREEFTAQYPDSALMEFPSSLDRDQYWGDDKSIRICEYFKREATKKTLYQLTDPTTGTVIQTEEKIDQWDVTESRSVKSHKIMWYKVSGNDILEGPTEWPGKYIPIVMVYGKEINVENRSVYRGVIRNAKDPQRLYNYSRSTSAETIALAPKAPYIISSKMIGAYKAIWDSAHKKNWPYLPFEADPQLPGLMPQRTPPVPVNTGIQAEIMIADQELHDTTGLQQANLGQRSNEKSGKAIMARQREGDIANFTYYDNLGRAIKYAGKVILDMIPRIYDTARIVRILGEDGKDSFVPVNQPVFNQQGKKRVFDLTAGKYDMVVTIGPSYSTQREEAADSMMAFLGAVPTAAPFIGDLVAKNMDWPGANEIEKRLKMLLPPGMADGGQAPPSAPGPPPPAPPGSVPPGQPVFPGGQPPQPGLDFQSMMAHADLEGKLLANRLTSIKIAQAEAGQGGPSTTRQ